MKLTVERFRALDIYKWLLRLCIYNYSIQQFHEFFSDIFKTSLIFWLYGGSHPSMNSIKNNPSKAGWLCGRLIKQRLPENNNCLSMWMWIKAYFIFARSLKVWRTLSARFQHNFNREKKKKANSISNCN